jgi:hypothetical protein
MGELYSPVGEASDRWGVRDHQDRVTFLMQLAEKIEYDLFVHFVEIAGGLVRQNQLGVIDQCARDCHALLLAAGKLRGEMF